MDLFIQANEAPSDDSIVNKDGVFPFCRRAELAALLGSGTMKFGDEAEDAAMYTSYAAVLLNVVEKSNKKPRPTGSQHTVPKMGVSMLFAASYEKLRGVMVDICNMVMGCSGSGDLIAWFLQLSFENDEDCGIMATDASNAFNAILRREIQYCLKTYLRPGMGWVEFMFWRWNSVLTEVTWVHPLTGVTHRLMSGTGITQGGLLSSFLCAIGQARVMDLLKAEFKEKLVSVKYADDCTFTYKVGSTVSIAEHPKLGPRAAAGQTTMPTPMAIFYRLKDLALEHMGVTFSLEGDHKQKCMQRSWEDGDQELFGKMSLVTGGLKVNGNPIGTDAFRVSYLRKFVTTEFAAYYTNLNVVELCQTKMLLEANTGGTLRLNHLMRNQPLRLWQSKEGLVGDEMSAFNMVTVIMQTHMRTMLPEKNELSARVWEQMGLQLDMAGTGTRHLVPEAVEAALLGGYDLFSAGVDEWVPEGHFLRTIDKDTSPLPAMRDMRSAMRSQTLADPALAKLLSLAAGKQLLAEED